MDLQEASRAPGPLEHVTLAGSQPGTCPPTCSVLYTAPRTTPTHSSQAPRDPEICFWGTGVQTEGEGTVLGKEGGHSRAAEEAKGS